MIDGIALRISSPSLLKKLLESNLFSLNIREETDTETGEYFKYYNGKYRKVNIRAYPNGKIFFHFSLHYFFNNGIHNYNDFHFEQIVETIEEFANIFGEEVLNAKIDNLEFGVNICHRINLLNLINHRRIKFILEKNGVYTQVEHKNNYIIKCYNKTEDCKKDSIWSNLSPIDREFLIKNEIYRIEAKYLRMKPLNKIGIHSFKDLLKPNIYPNLLQKLVSKWNEILFIDDTIDSQKIKGKYKGKINNWRNPNDWHKLADMKGDDRYNYNNELKIYRRVVKSHSDNIQDQIAKLIISKWHKLLNGKSLKVQTQNNGINKKRDTQITSKGLDVICVNKEKRCIITGLDISMQKEQSRFLFKNGAKYYYENHKETYRTILLSRLKKKYHNAPPEVQFEKIAHSIRNSDSNPRNNNRRAIQKLLETPSLFSNLDFINKSKLELAKIF